jgi:hypothetical protein
MMTSVSSQTWLLHLCHDCGSSGCIKTYRTWYKATVFGELDFLDDGDYRAGVAYFEERNRDTQSATPFGV